MLSLVSAITLELGHLELRHKHDSPGHAEKPDRPTIDNASNLPASSLPVSFHLPSAESSRAGTHENWATSGLMDSGILPVRAAAASANKIHASSFSRLFFSLSVAASPLTLAHR